MALSMILNVIFMVQMPGVYANGRNMPNALFHVPEAPDPDKIYQENPIYTVGETVEFRWFSRYDKVGIFVWQQYPDLDAGTSKFLVSDWTSSSFKWVPSRDWMTKLKDGEVAIAYLALYDSGSTQIKVISHYFNITQSEDSSSSKPKPSSTTKEVSTVTSELQDSEATTITVMHAGSTETEAPPADNEHTVVPITVSETVLIAPS
ncbi:hypothetical protein FOMG_17698 [Fusarium oxysporum f. sp. melonis 26406]|uniref:Uncharacterized protein n=1 Tax=Fusarium oxysporum f. sp. melonis 26406 TaxID=1089452 RepID=W9ZX63_FUSOX|nr:hypothetical protein FOMG_17698 [Fusarium oxysporum f. sp. melonis 26406]